MSISLLVFSLKDLMVAVVAPVSGSLRIDESLGLHIPSSKANTPIMVERFPQFPE
jgi:hypothetical protein